MSGRYSWIALLAAFASGGCVQDPQPPVPAEKIDYSLFGTGNVGDTWLYQARTFVSNSLADRRFSGTKSITLKAMETHPDSTVYVFMIRDSLKEVRKDSWGYVIKVDDHEVWFTKKGDSVAGGNENFPLGFRRPDCEEKPGRIKLDGMDLKSSVCASDPRLPPESFAFSAGMVEGIGKIYEEFHLGGGGNDSSGSIYTLSGFNGKAIKAGEMFPLGTRGFEGERYENKWVDSSLFVLPKVGDQWNYKRLKGKSYITCESVRMDNDTTYLTFRIRDSLEYINYRGTFSVRDTTYSGVVAYDSQGEAIRWAAGVVDQIPTKRGFAITKRVKLGEDSLYVSMQPTIYSQGATYPTGNLHIQSIGMAYSAYCRCVGTNSASSDQYSLESFNGRKINSDSLALALLGSRQ